MYHYKNNFNKEISLGDRSIASVIYILQSILVNNNTLENYRKKHVEKVTIKLRNNLSEKGLTKGETITVDYRENLSEKEFVKYYLNKGLPVVFTGEALNWPCCKKWNFDYFEKALGNTKLPLIESSGLMERELDPTGGQEDPFILEELTAKELVDAIKNGEKKYLRFSDFMNSRKDFIADLNNAWLKKMAKCFLGAGYKTFIGAAGRRTPIHAGTTAFLYIMADGEKKWTLYSAASSVLLNPRPSSRNYNFTDVDINKPDLNAYPGFDLLTRIECNLKKGDILFVPTWMWHEVENTTDSWGLRYGFTSLRGFFQHPTYAFVRVLLAKPFFLTTLYYAYINKTDNKGDKNLLINTMYRQKTENH